MGRIRTPSGTSWVRKVLVAGPGEGGCQEQREQGDEAVRQDKDEQDAGRHDGGFDALDEAVTAFVQQQARPRPSEQEESQGGDEDASFDKEGQAGLRPGEGQEEQQRQDGCGGVEQEGPVLPARQDEQEAGPCPGIQGCFGACEKPGEHGDGSGQVAQRQVISVGQDWLMVHFRDVLFFVFVPFRLNAWRAGNVHALLRKMLLWSAW